MRQLELFPENLTVQLPHTWLHLGDVIQINGNFYEVNMVIQSDSGHREYTYRPWAGPL